MVTETQSVAPLEMLMSRSAWYGEQAQQNKSRYRSLKTVQIIVAASIPIFSVGSPSDIQRWATAVLGSVVGIIEAILQLGQYQQNWLLCRATRDALKREDFLYRAKAGPYDGVTDPELVLIVRSDAIMSSESSQWLLSNNPKTTKG